MKTIDFYFDFGSPYAYLSHCNLPILADKYGYKVAYKPTDLFAAKVAAGNNGPPSIHIPMKFRYVLTDLQRWADRYGVPIEMPLAKAAGDVSAGPEKRVLTKGQTDSSRAHKGMYLAADEGRDREYANKMWRAVFGVGGLIGDDETLGGVVREMGWSPETFFSFVNSEEAGKRYEQENKDAQARGVFGVPIMMVGDEMWWGNDRQTLLEEYLAAH